MSSTIKQSSLLGHYCTMNGGVGHYSYAQNSSYQGGAVDAAKSIMEEEIAAKLDINSTQTTKPYLIADFGCSTGHNSFPAIHIITQAIEKRLQTQTQTQTPEFHVLFNDQVGNDFHTLFRSLPPQRNYHAVGVPGSFHGRLFPKGFLDFGYSSCSLHWLSEVPKAVSDPTHPAWNRGKVHYVGAKEEVFEAYSNQFAHDFESFLVARAEEVVSGGLMALIVPAVPAFENTGTSFTFPAEMDVLGSCLVDMANKGVFSHEKIDTFNFPLYFTIPNELKAIIERNNSFKMERMEVLDNHAGKRTLSGAKARATFMRAVFETMLINQFGGEQVMDELFDRYTDKLAASPHFLDPHNDKSIMILMLLNHNYHIFLS